MDMKFTGHDVSTYGHKSGIVDRSTCRTHSVPTSGKLVAWRGFYAVTKCCPIVSGFQLKYSSGVVVNVGSTPSRPIVAKASSSHTHVKKAAAFAYKSTAWTKASGELIGYGGASGGAWDSMYLVFNRCGPKYQLASLRKLLKAKTGASLSLLKITGQTKVLVAEGVVNLKKS